MPYTPNESAQGYGFGSLSVIDPTAGLVGVSDVTGEIDLSGMTPEIITSPGGWSDLPHNARAGRKSGEGKITLMECPDWLHHIASGGTIQTLSAAGGAGGSVGTPTTVSGTATVLNDINTKITADANCLAAEVFLKVGDAGALEVTVASERGLYKQTIASSALSAATVVTGTGLTITGVSALTGDQTVRLSVRPQWTSHSVVSVNAAATHRDYELSFYSVAGRSGQDALWEYTIRRVLIAGISEKLQDGQSPSSEINLRVLTPLDGGAPLTKRFIKKAAA